MSSNTLHASENSHEDEQSLPVEDPQNSGDITQADSQTREARWRSLMKNYPPLKQLPRSNMPNGSNHPPLYHFGIPYTYDWMIAYAKRHHLKLEISPEERKGWGGKECLDIRDIDFDSLSRHCRSSLRMLACHLSIRHIRERCEFMFEEGRPFAMEYDGILSLWSNYNMRERAATRMLTAARFKRTVADLVDAMSEEGGPKELMWWFDWDNNVGITTLD